MTIRDALNLISGFGVGSVAVLSFRAEDWLVFGLAASLMFFMAAVREA